MALSRLGEAALALARRGFHVFPLVPNTKRPLLDGGFKGATCGRVAVAGWWTEYPEANIGLYPAASGHVVVDVDVTSTLEVEEVETPLFSGDTNTSKREREAKSIEIISRSSLITSVWTAA